MDHINIRTGDLDSELKFTFNRSSGPGGQHVNKVNTKVELRFNVDLSKILTDKQKQIIKEKLVNKINQNNELLIIAQDTRSQLKNKKAAVDKFYSLIKWALTPPKKRTPTSITKSAKEKRLKEKKELSEKKNRRHFNE